MEMNTSYHDLGKPISNIVQDLNYSGTEPLEPCNYSYNPVPWLLFEFLFSVYSITILVVTFMRHRHHLEPVHLLTLSALLGKPSIKKKSKKGDIVHIRF